MMLSLTQLTRVGRKSLFPSTILKNLDISKSVYLKNLPFELKNDEILKCASVESIFRPKINLPQRKIALKFDSSRDYFQVLNFLKNYDIFYGSDRIKLDRYYFHNLKNLEDTNLYVLVDNVPDLNVYRSQDLEPQKPSPDFQMFQKLQEIQENFENLAKNLYILHPTQTLEFEIMWPNQPENLAKNFAKISINFPSASQKYEFYQYLLERIDQFKNLPKTEREFYHFLNSHCIFGTDRDRIFEGKELVLKNVDVHLETEKLLTVLSKFGCGLVEISRFYQEKLHRNALVTFSTETEKSEFLENRSLGKLIFYADLAENCKTNTSLFYKTKNLAEVERLYQSSLEKKSGVLRFENSKLAHEFYKQGVDNFKNTSLRFLDWKSDFLSLAKMTRTTDGFNQNSESSSIYQISHSQPEPHKLHHILHNHDNNFSVIHKHHFKQEMHKLHVEKMLKLKKKFESTSGQTIFE